MTNSEIKSVLTRALARLDNGKAWTQRFFARDASGIQRQVLDPRATCWCVLGAIYAEVGDDEAAFQKASAPLRRVVGSPALLNDLALDFSDVRTMVEIALERLDA